MSLNKLMKSNSFLYVKLYPNSCLVFIEMIKSLKRKNTRTKQSNEDISAWHLYSESVTLHEWKWKKSDIRGWPGQISSCCFDLCPVTNQEEIIYSCNYCPTANGWINITINHAPMKMMTLFDQIVAKYVIY